MKYVQLCDAFPNNDEQYPDTFHNIKDLRVATELLSLGELTYFELERMYNDSVACMKESKNSVLKKNQDEEVPARIPIMYVVAGSEILREHILSLDTDPVFCSLIKTGLADLVDHFQLKKLSTVARIVESPRVGRIIYTSSLQSNEWFVLLSGKLKVSFEEPLEETQDSREKRPEAKSKNKRVESLEPEFIRMMQAGDVFGGFSIVSEHYEVPHVKVEVASESCFVVFEAGDLAELVSDDGDMSLRIVSVLLGERFLFLS